MAIAVGVTKEGGPPLDDIDLEFDTGVEHTVLGGVDLDRGGFDVVAEHVVAIPVGRVGQHDADLVGLDASPVGQRGREDRGQIPAVDLPSTADDRFGIAPVVVQNFDVTRGRLDRDQPTVGQDRRPRRSRFG